MKYHKKSKNEYLHREVMKPILLDTLEELFPKEKWVVHHKDEDIHNNDIFNLEVMTFENHMSHHSNGRMYSNKGRINRHHRPFPGASYVARTKNPWTKVWQSRIYYNKRNMSLGYYEDPLSASIIYNLVMEEL